MKDAAITASFGFDSADPLVRKYIASVESRLNEHYATHGSCYNTETNELGFMWDRPVTQKMCVLPEAVGIPAGSPLFPPTDPPSAVGEALARVMVILEFFDPGTRDSEYKPGLDRGVLIMKVAASAFQTSDARGLLLWVSLSEKTLEVRAIELPSQMIKWRRNANITSLLDLSAKEVVLFPSIGRAEFFSEDVNRISKSVVLKSASIKIGGLRIVPSAWEAWTTTAGLPAFVFGMAPTDEGLLAGLR